jgi:hexosaminidase
MHNPQERFVRLIPQPASIFESEGNFIVSANTKIFIQKEKEGITSIANLLSTYLQQISGYPLAIAEHSDRNQGNIHLSLNGDTSLGEEGYELLITTDSVQLSASCPAGLFYGAQTLRQLLPTHPSSTVILPVISIHDIPRFEWRGAMLDVSRHFFGVDDVKRYIDLISHYKINRLHLHLSDDQGWRIEIKSWPRLTEVGGSTQVGGGKGGYYTQEQYKEIVEYASTRYVTIVPEIDTPGHTTPHWHRMPNSTVPRKRPHCIQRQKSVSVRYGSTVRSHTNFWTM